MRCVHCGCTLLEPVTECPSCKKNPALPFGFDYDETTDKYRMLAKGMDRRTKTPISVVTWYDPKTGEYSQEIFDADSAELGVKEISGMETGSMALAVSQTRTEAEREPDGAADYAPVTAEPEIVEATVDTRSAVKPEPVAADGDTRSAANPEPVAADGDTRSAASPELVGAAVDTRSAVKPEPVAAAVDTRSVVKPEPVAVAGYRPVAAEPVPAGIAPNTPPAVPFAPPAPMPEAYDSDSYRIEKKSRAGVILAVVIVILAALLAAGWHFGYFALLSERMGEQIISTTQPPEGAAIPAFLPLEPVEPLDELVRVPEDTKRSEDPEAYVSPINYYPELPNVSAFSSRALQDEKHIYFLPVPKDGSFSKPADLIRVQIGTSRMEKLESLWPGEERIYSFTLLGENIILCAALPTGTGYGFYIAPKQGGESMLLFEHPQPAFINVFEDKLYMLFAQDKKVGLFDPRNDISPTLFDLPSGIDNMELFPYFSVADGFIYYGGVHAGGGVRTSYFRAVPGVSLEAEAIGTITAAGIVINPVFDGDTMYCGILGTGGYSFCSAKEGVVQVYHTFAPQAGIPPIVAGTARGDLIALIARDGLTRYRLSDMTFEPAATAESLPYAAVKDYLIAPEGLYLNSDLSFTPFDAVDEEAGE